MMPPAECSGCGLPKGGASPSIFRIVEEGPANCIQASAVIWGGIIIGIIRQNTSAPLPRISLSATRKANPAPISTDRIVPPPAVISEWRIAVAVEGRASTFVR